MTKAVRMRLITRLMVEFLQTILLHEIERVRKLSRWKKWNTEARPLLVLDINNHNNNNNNNVNNDKDIKRTTQPKK